MGDNRVFSEDREHGFVDDMTQGLDEEYEGDVREMAVQRGVILTANCTNCGRQWKGIEPWGHIVLYYTNQAVPGTKRSREGIWVGAQCRCATGNGQPHVTPVLLTWSDIQRWADQGVRSGAVPREVFQAARTQQGR